MKKNRMMRIASLLLVAVLLTTSIISGTFAKYVTEGSKADNARVAKFGVEVVASGSLFAKNYFSDSSTLVQEDYKNRPANGEVTGLPATVVTVESSNGDNVVAPGTKSSKNGLKFTFTGTPEVDVKITLGIADGFKDVVLKARKYNDMTTAAPDDQFRLAEDYYPIVYTFSKNGEVLVSGNLQAIKDYLDTYSVYVNANTDLSAAEYTYTLTWEWEFGDAANNKADTVLGDLAAGTYGTMSKAYYELNTSAAITAIVAQVD